MWLLWPEGCQASHQPAAWLLWHSPLVSLDPRSPSQDTALQKTDRSTVWDTAGQAWMDRRQPQVPGAQLSTSAPRALPLLQSRLKLVIGRSGTLCWIQPRRRCLGVFDSAWVWKEISICLFFHHLLRNCKPLSYLFILPLPDWHGDGVVQDQRPNQTQDQLQIPIHNGFGVCGTQVRWDLCSDSETGWVFLLVPKSPRNSLFWRRLLPNAFIENANMLKKSPFLLANFKSHSTTCCSRRLLKFQLFWNKK